MYALKNDQLTVSILDPVADRARLGGRYCTGGYIYQVEDAKLGVLVSGPGFPSEEMPPVFDGQGLPESFRRRLGPGDDAAEKRELAIGVGMVEKGGQNVLEFCNWEVVRKPNAIIMSTRQHFAEYGLGLTREVRLEHRTIISETWLQNSGPRPIPVQWFPHPFFPWDESGECCKFSVPVAFPENAGYELRPSGFIARKLDHEWDRRGHFQLLSVPLGQPLYVVERHPKVGFVTTACEFPLSWLPIWGNCNTFSFEPYYETEIAVGQMGRWRMVFDF
jgi:hypothetical protein